MSLPADLDRWLAPLGLALCHFLWQGALVALAAWAAMTVARSARVRYAIGCCAMLAMLAAPIATLAWIGPDAPRPVARPLEPIDLPLAPRLAGEPARRPTPPRPTTPTPTFRARVITLAPQLVAPWLAGVALVATFHLVGLARVSRLRRAAVPIDDAAWRERVDRLAQRLGLRRAVALAATVRLDAPAVVGVFRPVILWPAAALTGLAPQQVEALLAHELAHVRRHDYLVNLAQAAIETLLFYHPAVWWLGRRIRAEREHCCDDLAAAAIGDANAYAGALAAMESLRGAPSPALGANDGPLLARVRRLVAPTPAAGLGWLGIGLQLLTLALVIVLVAIGSRRDAPKSKLADATTRPASTKPAARGDYRIAPDDLLRIDIADLATTGMRESPLRRVSGSGQITVPYLKPLDVLGLTEIEVEQLIARRYREEQILVSAAISVLALQRSDGVNVPPAYFGGPAAAAAPEPAAAVTPAPIPETIAPGDLIRVSIGDLAAAGLTSQFVKRVAADGTIGMPYLDKPFPIAGQKPADAQRALSRAYHEAQVIVNAQVDVLVVQLADGRQVVPAAVLGDAAPKPAAPPEPVPIPSKIGAGDLVRIVVYDLTGTGKRDALLKRVDANGAVSLPYIDKPLPIAGQTPTDAERAISKAFASAQVLTNANVEVLVVQLADGRQVVPAALVGDAAPPAAAPPVPVPATIPSTIGPGDLLRIVVHGLTGAGNRDVLLKRVDADGTLTLPYVAKPLAIAGQTPAGAERAVSARFQDAQVLANALVEVLVVQLADGRTIVPAGLLGDGATPAADEAQQKRIDALAAEVERLKGNAPATAPATAPAADAPEPRVTLPADVRALAARDGGLLRLVAMRDDAAAEYVARRATSGKGAASVVALRQRLAALDNAIDEYARELADAEQVRRRQEQERQIEIARQMEAAAKAQRAAASRPTTQAALPPDVAADPTVQDLQRRLAEADAAMAAASEMGDADGPRVRQMASMRDLLREQLNARAEAVKKAQQSAAAPAAGDAQQRVDALTAEVDRLKRDAATAPEPPVARPADAGEAAEPDPLLERMKRTLGELESQLAELNATRGPGSPIVKKLEGQRDWLRARIESLEAAIDAERKAPATQPSPSTQAADADRTMQRLQQQLDAAELELSSARARQGEAAPIVAKLTTVRDAARAQLAARVAVVRERQEEAAIEAGPLGQKRKLDAQRAELLKELARATAEGGEQGDAALAVRGMLSRVDRQIAELTGLVGEYYMGGHVVRPGVYSLSGRRITLGQAIIAAGGVEGLGAGDATWVRVLRRDPAGDAEQSILRRVGPMGEGAAPDVTLMPDDQVMVGVNPPATRPAAGAATTMP